MPIQTAVSRNSRPLSSRKSGSFSTPRRATRQLALAAEVARKLGIVATWANVQTIRLAMESEAAFSGAPPKEVAEMFFAAASEGTPQFGGPFHCPSEWGKREAWRLNTVDRFWFEDARWRHKGAYAQFRERLRLPA